MSLYMNVRTQFKNLIAGVLVIGVTMVSPSAVHAQSQKKMYPERGHHSFGEIEESYFVCQN